MTSDTLVHSTPMTSHEAKSLADVYIVAARGACGTAATAVEDAGRFWKVRTVYGLGEQSGPELHIDKFTREISVIQTD